jgi:hypothetical protein
LGKKHVPAERQTTAPDIVSYFLKRVEQEPKNAADVNQRTSREIADFVKQAGLSFDSHFARIKRNDNANKGNANNAISADNANNLPEGLAAGTLLAMMALSALLALFEWKSTFQSLSWNTGSLRR